MHGHFCLHDLIVFLTMVWEGLTCCLRCGHHMLYVGLKRFKNAARHKHIEVNDKEVCPTCIAEDYRARVDPN